MTLVEEKDVRLASFLLERVTYNDTLVHTRAANVLMSMAHMRLNTNPPSS